MVMNKKKGTEHKKEQKHSRGRLWTGSIIAALAAAGTLFFAMMQIEKNMLSEYERAPVYVVAQTIPKGQLLTADNLARYLTLEEVEKRLVPETALQDSAQISGLMAVAELEKGVLLTKGMFQAVSEITEEMKQPVIAGFKAEDLYQVVGGVLRSGDKIHIYQIKEDGTAGMVWEGLYIQEVFDLSGNTITNDDTITAAQRVNIYLDEEDVEAFYASLTQSTLRVVKAYE